MNGAPIADALPTAVPDSATGRLAELFDAHYDRLYRLARRLTQSADAARDLVQETFLRAARAPQSIPHGAGDEEAWLVRVLVNRQRDEWRKSAVRAQHRQRVQHAPSTDDPAVALIARATIWRALDALTPRRRAVLVLHELEGMAAADIAALLGVSAMTVRWHVARGRRELANLLGARSDR